MRGMKARERNGKDDELGDETSTAFPLSPSPFFSSHSGDVPSGVQPSVEMANLTHFRTMDFKEHAMEKPEGEMVKRSDRMEDGLTDLAISLIY